MDKYIVTVQGDTPRKCSKCSQSILSGDLCVFSRKYWLSSNYYHLKCFRPGTDLPLDFTQHIECEESLSEAQTAAVRKRVNEWNRQFQVKVPPVYLRKAVKTTCPASRRALLEVFIYLTPTEVEQVAAFACKEWFHTSRDEELWRRQYLALFPPPAKHCSYRELAITKRLESCWRCKRQLTLMEVEMVCPVRSRWLCRGCRGDCVIVKLREYCKDRLISIKLVNFFGVRVFLHKGAKSIYLQDIKTCIIPYAQSRHRRLIEALESHYSSELSPALLKMIRDFKIEDLYDFLEESDYAFAEFFGKCEENEDFDKSVKAFVKSLMKYRE